MNCCDVIALTETFLNNSVTDGELFPPGFIVLRKDRGNNAGWGGVLLAVRDSFIPKLITDVDGLTDDKEILLVKMSCKKVTFLVCVVYIPPSSSENRYLDILASIENAVCKYSSLFDMLIIGDFNLNSAGISTKLQFEMFVQFCKLSQHNVFVNCYGGLLDLVLSNMASGNVSVSADVVPLVSIDLYHPPFEVTLSLPCGADVPDTSYPLTIVPDTNPYAPDWNFRRADFYTLYATLSEIDWNDVLGLQDIESATDIFYRKLNDVISDCVPVKANINYSEKRQCPPWFTSEIIKKLKVKYFHFRKYKELGLEFNREVFKYYRSHIKELIDEAHRRYMVLVGSNIRRDPTQFWKHVRERRKSRVMVNEYTLGGATVIGQEAATAFAEYFASVFLDNVPVLDSEVAASGASCVADARLITLDSVTVADVRRAIQRVRASSAAGPDAIPPFLVKDCSSSLEVPLLHLFNISLKASKYPDKWKLSRVTPVPKIRTSTDITSHRPIAVLVDAQSTSTVDVGTLYNGDSELDKNGHNKQLRRLDTVPDIKRDTSGITTQYIATGIVNLGALAAGVCVAWSSSALPDHDSQPSHDESLPENNTQITSGHRQFTLDQFQASWAASSLCLGALFGAVPTGLISQYFGRKKTLLYLALPLVVSWILVASSPNVYGVYLARFVGGIAVGAFSVGIPPYVEDIAEKLLLPTLANFYQVHFSCGVLFGYVIGVVESSTWLSVLCATIPIAFFVAFIFLPESPTYLMSQGKFHEAKAALLYFRGIDNDIDTEMKELKEYLRSAAKTKVTFKELFGTRATVKALVVSFGLMIFQQLSGIYPILFYARKIFKTFAIPLSSPSAAIILGFCLVSSTYFTTMLLKVARRRVLLLTSFLGMAMSLGILGIYYNLKESNISMYETWIPLFCLCFFVIIYAVGVGPIPWLMLREIFPYHMTRRATAITAGFHWFLAFGVTKLYQNLNNLVKPGWTLCNFAVCCLVGAVFVYFFVPETKDRTLSEIQDEFDGIHKKKKHTHIIEVESFAEA